MRLLVFIPAFIFLLKVSGQSDSLNGFDRETVIREGIIEGHSGAALRNYVWMQQQRFIDLKYRLQQRPTGGGSPPGLGPYGCDGNDFENDIAGSVTYSTQLQGWLYTQGYNGYLNGSSTSTMTPYYPGGLTNANGCNLAGCCPLPPQSNGAVINTGSVGIIDPFIGAQYPIFSVFGADTSGSTAAAQQNPHLSGQLKGNKVLRINNLMTGDYSIGKIVKRLMVDTSNSFFSYAYIGVLQTGHTCCDGAVVHFNFRSVPGGSLISAISNSFSAPGNNCAISYSPSFYASQTGIPYQGNAATIYNRWDVRHLDLRPYIGQTIEAEVIVTDCNAGGHFGIIYYDSECGELKTRVNGLTSYSGCPDTYTIDTEPSIKNGLWLGPNNFSIAASSFTTNSSGVYTLIVNNSGGLPSLTKTISIQSIGATPIISPLPSTVCAFQSVSISVTGLSTYTWSNGVVDTGFLDTLFFGNRTYTVEGLNDAGCTYTLTKELTCLGEQFYCQPADPIICLGKSTTLFAYPGINYLWSTGVTGGQIIVTPFTTTTYSVSNSNGPGNCIYTKTITVTVSLCDNVDEVFMQADLKIHPNPAHHEITFCTEVKGVSQHLIIRNSLGEVVLQKEVTSSISTFSVSELPPGLYLVELKEGQRLAGRQKLVLE